jgi:hypothetical protein
MSGMTNVGLSTNKAITVTTAIDLFANPVFTEASSANLKNKYIQPETATTKCK